MFILKRSWLLISLAGNSPCSCFCYSRPDLQGHGRKEFSFLHLGGASPVSQRRIWGEQVSMTKHRSSERNDDSHQIRWSPWFFFPTSASSCLSAHSLILGYFPESCALLDGSKGDRLSLTRKQQMQHLENSWGILWEVLIKNFIGTDSADNTKTTVRPSAPSVCQFYILGHHYTLRSDIPVLVLFLHHN